MRDRDEKERPDSVLSTIDESMKRVPEALADTQRYALNIAAWLSGT
jgi:hypothetical protein